MIAVELLQEAGAKRLIPLNVSDLPYSFIESASQKKLVLEDVEFNDFACPLVGNTEAKVMEKNELQNS